MPEVLNLFELGERLNLDVNWLHKEAEAGRLPYLPAASRMLFNPAAVTAALAELAKGYPPPKVKRSRRGGAHAG
ncbi:MAG: hypothetical protein K8U57_00080 [Planctomycetes bacterium]|nr:hypothetical protein [Planctomycetota bacterium]